MKGRAARARSGEAGTEERRRPTRDERRELFSVLRDSFPTFSEAVLADARIFCAGRGERARFHNQADAALQALRLMWTSDAFLALAAYRAKARLQALGVPLLPRLFHRVAMAVGQVCIGDPVVVHAGIYLPHGQVVIDGLVEIEQNVVIRPWVTIGLKENDVRGATIERGASIGTGAKVLGPVRIGRRARIGANAVVVKDVPKEAVAVGVPARVISRPDQPSRQR